MKPSTLATIPALTGARFIAALMVFVSHFPIPGVGGAFKRMTDSGYIGVTFFFILSGFMVGYNYSDKFDRDVQSHTLNYFVARFARVYPLYLFCILYAWFSSGMQISLPLYLAALQAWGPDVKMAFGLDGPSWSISVEAFFYATFPLVVIVFRALGVFRNRNRLLTAAGVVFATIFGLALYFALTGRGELWSTDPMSAHRWLYRMPLTRVLDFMLGVLAAAYFTRFAQVNDPTSRKRWSFLAYPAFVIIVTMTAWKPMFFSSFSWDAAYAVPFVVFIIGAAMCQDSWYCKVLSFRPMIVLGESSFAFYLIHMMMSGMYSRANTGWAALVSYFMFLALVAAVSIGLHEAIEKPCRRLVKRAFEIRWAGPRENRARGTLKL